MSELKLRRLTEHNQRLREDLARPRVRVSEASARSVSVDILNGNPSHSSVSLIRYCKTTRDHLVRSCRAIALLLAPADGLLVGIPTFSSGPFGLGSRPEERGSIRSTKEGRWLLYHPVTGPPRF